MPAIDVRKLRPVDMAISTATGKTVQAESACIGAALYGHRDFVCLIGSDEGHAMEMLESRRNWTATTCGWTIFPQCSTPHTRMVPTVEETEPWVDSLVRLWDDADTLKAVDRFPDRYFDWIHLDADHSCQAVAADLGQLLDRAEVEVDPPTLLVRRADQGSQA